MLEIERPANGVAGAGMRDAERFGLGPVLEMGLAAPHRVRGVERVVLGFRALQQVKFDEARHFVQLRVAIEPDLLERLLRAARNAKAVHGDKHGNSSVCASCGGWLMAGGSEIQGYYLP